MGLQNKRVIVMLTAIIHRKYYKDSVASKYVDVFHHKIYAKVTLELRLNGDKLV